MQEFLLIIISEKAVKITINNVKEILTMKDCETCAYYTYDEEWECYVCEMNLDEDEYARFVQGHYRQCPYYRDGDEYKIARKQ